MDNLSDYRRLTNPSPHRLQPLFVRWLRQYEIHGQDLLFIDGEHLHEDHSQDHEEGSELLLGDARDGRN